MKPGDWAMIDGYDGEAATTALVTATSTHKTVIKRADADRLIAERHLAPVRDVTWRSVLASDHYELGDDCEFHEFGTGRRWVEATLCGPTENTDG